MNRMMFIGLCISLILLSGCQSSYNDCKYDCYKINNCSVKGSFCIPPPCAEHTCTERELEICFNECK